MEDPRPAVRLARSLDRDSTFRLLLNTRPRQETISAIFYTLLHELTRVEELYACTFCLL
jgi:hypothetical protein